MPLYDAKCKRCGAIVRDIFATAPTLKIIQKCICGSTEFEKMPSAPAVRFEGNDWATKKSASPADDK